jgi:low affinity Fe/Cu permease
VHPAFVEVYAMASTRRAERQDREAKGRSDVASSRDRRPAQSGSERRHEEEASGSDAFRRIAHAASEKLGSHWAFIAAVALIIGWAASGPLFDFSETWQLIINTGTTVITFLMVFLIQSTQNRDAKAIHLKLDELIRASEARNVFADLEDASEGELDAFQREFEQLRKDGKHGVEAATEARDRALERPEPSPRREQRHG